MGRGSEKEKKQLHPNRETHALQINFCLKSCSLYYIQHGDALLIDGNFLILVAVEKVRLCFCESSHLKLIFFYSLSSCCKLRKMFP